MVMWSILPMTLLSAVMQAMVVKVVTWQMNGLLRVVLLLEGNMVLRMVACLMDALHARKVYIPPPVQSRAVTVLAIHNALVSVGRGT